MSPEQRARLEEVIEKGFPLFSSQCMQMGLQVYRRRFRDFAVFTLLYVSSFLLLINLGSVGILALFFIVLPLLNAGLYLAANSTVQNEEWKFNRFFDVLPQAAPLILNNALGILIGTLILMPTYFLLERIGYWEWFAEAMANPTATPEEPPMMTGSQSMAFFLNMVPFMYLMVGFSWSFPLILFMGANPLNALEYSRRLINRAWGAQFWLLFTFFSMFMMGLLLLVPISAVSVILANIFPLALFLILPWAYSSLYIGFHIAMKPREE